MNRRDITCPTGVISVVNWPHRAHPANRSAGAVGSGMPPAAV
ncbi:hypothetical protein ACFTZB_41690 [Rhodococcus sp. NPDC057014]